MPPKPPIRPANLANRPVVKALPILHEEPDDREYKGLVNDEAPPVHDVARILSTQTLPSNWNALIPGRNRGKRQPLYTDPADIYKFADEPILVRQRHNMHICAVCGLRLGDFSRLANIRTRAMNTLLFRRAMANTISLQAVADTINMIKGDKVVNLEWVIKYFRHDISDLSEDEIRGTFAWKETYYNRKVSEKRATQVIHGMQHIIRQRVANERLINAGVIPTKAIMDLKDPKQLHAEVLEAGALTTEQERQQHMNKIKANKVQILGGLLRRED